VAVLGDASFQPQWDAVTPECRQAFDHLRGQRFIQNFYLAGGTALALQIGHRVSTDLDWFTSTWALRTDQRIQIAQALGQSGEFDPSRQADGLMFGRVLGADVSFIYLPVPLQDKPVSLQGAALASVAEIGVMKLVAIRDRGRRRDFVDLYGLKDRAPIEQLVELAEAKYAAYPDLLPTVARGLAYFDDAESEPMPRMHRRVRWADVRKYAEQGAKYIVQRERRKSG
jgi:hypothetical protein